MTDQSRFTMTTEHVALLRAACVSWYGDQWGAAAVDQKRPYGSGELVKDLARILGVAPDCSDEWGDPSWSEPVAERLLTLHRETETALQVVLRTGSFEPGEYEAERCTSKWRRVRAAG